VPNTNASESESESNERMKTHSSVEALYALIFAICVLLALFLLTS
jgi:hypothetical protein